jgi:SAM-dependent methyltransferase
VPANNLSKNSYLYSHLDDRERQVFHHRVFRAQFWAILQQIFDTYGLGERFKTTTDRKLKILDVGCGVGLYLRTVAEALVAHDWLNSASLYGIDNNELAIRTAIEYNQQSKPRFDNLDFYVHNILWPLEDCPGLYLDGQRQFDFIFATNVMQYIPDAHQQLKKLYHALTPGGVLYLFDLVLHHGEDGCLLPPSLEKIGHHYFDFLAKLNGGIDISIALPDWLHELGATQVQTTPYIQPVGGKEESGKLYLRELVMVTSNVGPSLVTHGLLTQAEFEATMARAFRELDPNSTGQVTYINTIARKPLSE